jgi:hypothetical protein
MGACYEVLAHALPDGAAAGSESAE